MTTMFALLCLIFAVRFAFPHRFQPLACRPPGGAFRHWRSCRHWAFLRFFRYRRWHPDEYRDDAFRAADAQKYPSSSCGRCRGECASHHRSGARIESESPDGAGQHRHHDVGLHRTGPSRRGLDWCATCSPHFRRAIEPCLRNGPVSDRGHHVAFEFELGR